MALKNRIAKLESAAGVGTRYGYMCIIPAEWMDWDTPEERAKGYKVQPYAVQFGGTGEDPFYLATLEELEAFQARPDVDLKIIEFVSEGEDEKP